MASTCYSCAVLFLKKVEHHPGLVVRSCSALGAGRKLGSPTFCRPRSHSACSTSKSCLKQSMKSASNLILRTCRLDLQWKHFDLSSKGLGPSALRPPVVLQQSSRIRQRPEVLDAGDGNLSLPRDQLKSEGSNRSQDNPFFA